MPFRDDLTREGRFSLTRHNQSHVLGSERRRMDAGTIRRTRELAVRQGSRPGLAKLDSGLSRRSTVMRLGTGQPEQPAYSRVIRRRSALPNPTSLTPGSNPEEPSPYVGVP